MALIKHHMFFILRGASGEATSVLSHGSRGGASRRRRHARIEWHPPTDGGCTRNANSGQGESVLSPWNRGSLTSNEPTDLH